MIEAATSAQVKAVQEHEHETYSKAVLGFWTYIMTDCILFSVLFTTYIILHSSTFGGPTSQELFNLPLALGETFALLFSSFASGLGMLGAKRNKKMQTLLGFACAFALGLVFVGLEVSEFAHLIREGSIWKRSAFLSSYFTLVGTHGLHVSVGLFWMFVMMIQVFFYGLTTFTFRRLVCLNMFWHFLDVVWIFIFTVVYLMGVS